VGSEMCIRDRCKGDRNGEFLKDVALAVAQEQHLETVRKMIVKGIKDKAGVAVVPPPVSRIRG